MATLTPEQFKARFPNTNVGGGSSVTKKKVLTPEEFKAKFPNTTVGKKEVSKEEGVKGLGGFGVGLVKGVGRAIRGIGEIGEDVGNLVLPKRFEPKNTIFDSSSQRGAEVKEQLRSKGTAEKVGGFVGDVAQFAIPGTAVTKATKALPLIPRLGARALTSGGVATAQEGQIGKESAIAAGSEIVLPGVSKALNATLLNPNKRLLKSFGSALSGQSSEVLEAITKAPITSGQVAKTLARGGEREIVQAQANTILKGIQNIRRDAGRKFGKALEGLAKEDIDPLKIRMNTTRALSNNGITVKGGRVLVDDSQILDDAIKKRAEKMIVDVNSKTDLSGAGVRRIMDFVESKKFTTVGGNADRGAFNKLADDISGAFRKAVNESTNKLKQANKDFSEERGLVDAIEKIFGKVKFGKDVDLDNIARKVDALFRKKGNDPNRIDDFLNRIGADPDKFRASEATRQILTKDFGANAPGTSISELIRSITSSFVTPQAVAKLARITGYTTQVLSPILNELKPATRALFIKSILGISDDVKDEFK